MSFLDELRRRHVVRVALVYAATGFVVLQAADLIASGLALPAWIFAAATVVTILGFPVAVVLAWAFEITPHRVQRTAAGNGDAVRWLSRRTVAAVGVALLLVLGGGWFINPVVSERLARTAVSSRPAGPVVASLLAPPGERWADRGTSFAVSPDGRTVAIVGFDEGGGGSRLSLRDIDRFTTRLLPTTRGADLPFWSPDGRAIGFFADDQLRVIDLATGQLRTLCPAPISQGGSWGADDIILYTQAGGLHRTTATGETCDRVPLRDAESLRPGRPYFLGDGRHYVIAAHFESWLGRMGDDALTLLERRNSNSQAVVAAPDHLLFQTGDGNALYAQRIDVRRRRMSGTATTLFEYVTSPTGRPTVSTSANGVMVVRGPGNTRFRILQWTDHAGLAMDSLHVPDGFWMVRSSNRPDRVALGGWQFALYDRSRGVTTVLLRNESPRPSPFGSPVWAPGDTLIAFRSGDSDSLGIQVLDPRTGATRALGLPPEMRMAIPVDWSRDGRLLALILRPPGEWMRREAWVYDIVSGEARRLFVDPGHVGDIRFSPDGEWVAWQSLAQGGPDVYVRALHGGGAPLRVSPESGSRNPRWSADGRELYFQSTGTGALMVVSVRPEADPPFSAPHQLRALTSLALVDYEPTPDGGFALHLQRGSEPAPTLVLDWTKLLQREERRQ
jgi:eukaryotic-like serine/threonine-protein kinase